MSELKIIIPVYNEEGAISDVISDWTQTLNSLEIDYTIYTFNDGSKDQTLNILNQLAKENQKLYVVDKPNSGHGPTILKGYKENLDAQWLFQIDSDNELKANEFEKFWKARNDFDFLIGYRIQRNSPLPRIITTLISRLTVGFFYGNRVKDVNAPFRLIRTSKFHDDILRIPDDTFAPNLIVSGIANLRKLRIQQFPVTHHHRETGEVSIKKWKLFKAAFKSLIQTIMFRFK
ncbi:glycosyltransferase family 2 protein [Pseudotenacibaculum sp. MALMAid0570]|uniref:glycosyltransferase family 2 protein n=1 Tax=Pseudotenacibaculum sp. MALMAid0570 TaxID=3143938 RepID=UPI0032E00B8E